MKDIKMQMFVDRVTSPIGELRLIWDESITLRALEFADHEQRLQRLLGLHYQSYQLQPAPVPNQLRHPLEAYFEGDLLAIDSVPVQTNGTPFQSEVWAALRQIPAGTTTSYGQLAKQIGRSGASRAVGLANGSNPVGIVVPCHRVIGASGALTGYGGGIDRKRWLLAHERAANMPALLHLGFPNAQHGPGGINENA
jgi:methylated-DNA-[protein]-cysteine S-methyltransferase